MSTEGRIPDGSDLLGLMAPTPGASNHTAMGPFFIEHPRSQTVPLGEPLTLQARVGLAVAVEWRRDGVPLPGQTSPVLMVPKASFESAGEYVCVAMGPEGSVLSQPARVTVLFTYDGWAAFHGIGAAHEDDDADSVANGWEFLAGPDPKVPPGGTLEPKFLGWPALGEEPRVAVEVWVDPRAVFGGLVGEFSTDLREDSWVVQPLMEEVSPPPLTDGPALMRVSIPVPSGRTQQFFRLRLEP